MLKHLTRIYSYKRITDKKKSSAAISSPVTLGHFCMYAKTFITGVPDNVGICGLNLEVLRLKATLSEP